jgi:hypothetical protein
MSQFGPTRTSGDVCFRAAAKGIADMDRALVRSVSIYEVHALATRARSGMISRSTPSRLTPISGARMLLLGFPSNE